MTYFFPSSIHLAFVELSFSSIKVAVYMLANLIWGRDLGGNRADLLLDALEQVVVMVG